MKLLQYIERNGRLQRQLLAATTLVLSVVNAEMNSVCFYLTPRG